MVRALADRGLLLGMPRDNAGWPRWFRARSGAALFRQQAVYGSMREATRRMVSHALPVSKLTETIAEILQAHRTGAATPTDTVARSYARIRAHGDPALFISLRDEAAAIAEAKTLTAAGAGGRPLYGIPVAIKDNIDAEG